MHFETPNISKELIASLKKIKCAIFDVDGVMTSGQLHYSAEGELVKVFNVLDGQGLKSLQNVGIHVAVISAKRSDALIKRLDDLNIKHRFLGTHEKLSAYEELLSSLAISDEECCYTGDDLVDIPVMLRCGVAFSVPNAHSSARHVADHITSVRGGEGAVREICDSLLFSQQT